MHCQSFLYAKTGWWVAFSLFSLGLGFGFGVCAYLRIFQKVGTAVAATNDFLASTVAVPVSTVIATASSPSITPISTSALVSTITAPAITVTANVQATCLASKRVMQPLGIPSSIPFFVGKDDLATLNYSQHYNFRAYPKGEATVKEYIRLFERWHHQCKALDVGGRNGELRPLFTTCEYFVLERDPPKIKANQKFTITCDIYDCNLPDCGYDIILSRNVLEHLIDPFKAVGTVLRLLKPGGFFLIWTPWTWRYHAQPTYGDYFRYSAKGLESLCLHNGLNPMISFYEHYPQKEGKLAYGYIELDTPPWPNTLNLESYAFCYKPRQGERIIRFEEVGAKPVAEHPRMDVDFREPRSEGKTTSGIEVGKSHLA